MGIFSICVAITLLLVTQVQNGATDSSVCDGVRCSSSPKGYQCTETKSDNPKIEKRLGPLKDCCPVYYCQKGTNEPFLFVGANEKRKLTTEKPSTDDSGACKNISCPQNQEDSEDDCTEEMNSDEIISTFAEEKISCCPVRNCGSGTTRFTMLEGKLPPVGELATDGKHCEGLTCEAKPKIQDTICSKQPKDSAPAIGATLGKLKDCCPIWECKHSDGSVYSNFRIQGRDFRFKEIQRKPGNASETVGNDKGKNKGGKDKKTGSGRSLSNPELTGASSTTPDPKLKKKDKNKTNETKGEEEMLRCKSGHFCPKQKNDSCSYETSKESEQYVPKEERCCPVMYCLDKKGLRRTHYAKFSGKIPTEPAEIAKEKGKSSKSNKCSKITCGEKPKMSKPKHCSPKSTKETLFPKVQPFASCCDMQECAQEDGSYSQELSITGSSFSYFEVSFYKVPIKKHKDKGKSKDTDDDGSKWMTVGDVAHAIERPMVSMIGLG